MIEMQSSVWTWLGPVLLFVGTLITLFVTVTSTNKREWNKWRRDTLIKLCSDAVDAAQEVDAKCQSALDQKVHAFSKRDLTAASKSAARIGTIAEQLYLMGANHLADTCVRMKEAAEAVNLPASHLRTARINAQHRVDSELKQINSEGPAWMVEGSTADIEYQAKLTEMHQRIYQEGRAAYEDRYSTVREELEAIRAKFINRGRLELKSTS